MEVLVSPWSKNFQVKVRLWKTGMFCSFGMEGASTHHNT